MKNLFIFALFISLSCTVACTTKSTIFRAPDETSVKERKDLTLPPDYELRPPKEETKK